MSTSQGETTTGPKSRMPSGRGKREPARSKPTRRRTVVRRVDPWSVLKLSVIFYFCALLVVMVGLTILWSVIIRLGVLTVATDFLEEFGIEARVNGGNLARVVFLFGLVNVVLWTGVNVFLAFMYNLVSDIVGGLRVTLEDGER
jgi:hypothetical protein